MKPPLNYLMLHTGTLADELDAILKYRTTHAGLVTSGAAAAPTVSTSAPAYADVGETLDVVVIGANFVTACATTFSGSGITVNSTTFESATRLTVNITVSATAAQTARTLTITNPDTQTGALSAGITVTIGPWLPYGSADASVVWRHALTATPSYTGYTTSLPDVTKGVDQAGPEHHGTYGMRGAAAGGTSASAYLVNKTAGGDFATGIDTAGQISFEISTNFITQDVAQAVGGTGEILGSVMTPFSFARSSNNDAMLAPIRNSGSGGRVGIERQSAGLAIAWDTTFDGWAARTADNGRFHSYGKPASGFTRINMGWYTDGADRRVVLAVDGIVLETIIRTDTTSTPFEYLCLGASQNNFFGLINITRPMTGANDWIRNLQISTLAPVIPTTSTGIVKDIAILSDSIIGANQWEADSLWDNGIYARVMRALERRKIRPSSFYRSSCGGHTITNHKGSSPLHVSFSDSSNDSNIIVSSGSVSANMRQTVKDLNPTCIILNGGSNDVAYSATATEVRDAIRDHLEFFCGLNGNSAPGVVPSYIFVTNICDRGTNWDATKRALAATFRTQIDLIPAWFAATYPSAGCTVAVIDTFTGMGGTSTYTGKIGADEVHPGYAGTYKLGETIGAALANIAT